VRAKLIEGNPNLWKVLSFAHAVPFAPLLTGLQITYRPDLYAAEQMLKERQRQVCCEYNLHQFIKATPDR
jgi:hypothetical protein